MLGAGDGPRPHRGRNPIPDSGHQYRPASALARRFQPRVNANFTAAHFVKSFFFVYLRCSRPFTHTHSLNW